MYIYNILIFKMIENKEQSQTALTAADTVFESGSCLITDEVVVQLAPSQSTIKEAGGDIDAHVRSLRTLYIT